MTQHYWHNDMHTVRVAGVDARDLLGRLSVGETRRRDDGAVFDNAWTTEKGKLLAVATHLQTAVQSLLVAQQPGQHLVNYIESMTFRERVKPELETLTALSVYDAPDGTLLRALAGPGSDRADRSDTTPGDHAEPTNTFRVCVAAESKVFVWSGTLLGLNGQHALVATAVVPQLRETLMPHVGSVMTDEACERRRIELGVGRWGREWTSERNPHEAGLGTLIAWDKGCYVGQEVVARLDTYDKVQQQLVRLSLDWAPGRALDLGALVGSDLSVAGERVGVLTSIARTEVGAVALGYIHRRAADAAEVAVLAGSESVTARCVRS